MIPNPVEMAVNSNLCSCEADTVETQTLAHIDKQSVKKH